MSANKICFVTGANKGIGFATVKDLCKKFDGIVYMTSRDEGRGKEALESLKKEGLSAKYHQLDIDDRGSIDRLAKYIQNTYGGFDVLVNNAAIAYKNNATEPFGEQAENTLRVNYFATKYLCEKLFLLLRPHARVVNVSSCVGMLSYVNGDEPQASQLRQKLASDQLTYQELDDLMNGFVQSAKDGTWKQKGWQSSTYSVSKVGLSALTRIQQRDFNSDPREDLVVNHIHPGYVDTDMTSHKGPLTIEEGAVCSVYAALLPPNINEPKGSFLWRDTQVVDWVNGPAPARY